MALWRAAAAKDNFDALRSELDTLQEDFATQDQLIRNSTKPNAAPLPPRSVAGVWSGTEQTCAT
jgi:hypothetical protein